MIARILGTLLRGRRAQEKYLLWNELAPSREEAALQLVSPAFRNETSIPVRFAGHGVGDNVSPALSWRGVPAHAVELVLVMEDPDAPLRKPFVHLIALIHAPFGDGIEEGGLSADAARSGMIYGLSTLRKPGYSGPRALPGHGAHRYVFQLYALGKPSGLHTGAKRHDLVAGMTGKVIARGRLCGYFERA
jgi:Raf kinase inhibitor-like YbhB/YbcL family protein